MMDLLSIAVIVVFIGIYAAISTEKVDRTGTSLLGLALVGIVFWIGSTLVQDVHISFVHVVETIEWPTILFVTSMFIVVAVAGGSGMFQYLALRLAGPSEGVYKKLYTIFLLFVFAISLFVDNVSTILIMAPLTVQVCQALDMDFKPLLISEAIVANIGSIPSIVGAVPNIVIAKEANIDAGNLFLTFMPLSFILFLVTWLILTRYFSDAFVPTDPQRVDLLFRIRPATMIKSRRDFYASIIAFAVLITGFILKPLLGIEASMVALLVAAGLLILAHDRANEFLEEVGWSTIFFLVGLFGMVGALEIVGIIDLLGDVLVDVIGDNTVIAVVFMVTIPAVLSAFLDNLPVSAVLAPVALRFTAVSPLLPLALVYAVNVGGNILTPLGSPSNMVAIAASEREHDPISFADFAKAGTLAGVFHLAFGVVWILLIEFFSLLPILLGGVVICVVGFLVIILPDLRGNGKPSEKEREGILTRLVNRVRNILSRQE